MSWENLSNPTNKLFIIFNFFFNFLFKNNAKDQMIININGIYFRSFI